MKHKEAEMKFVNRILDFIESIFALIFVTITIILAISMSAVFLPFKSLRKQKEGE